MKFKPSLALALILAGCFWIYVAVHSGTAYPSLLSSLTGHAHNVALAEAGPQEQFTSDEQRDIGIYKQVSPSVVNITSQIMQWGFFGPEPASGQGSGFFINTDGYILTNYHVVEGAQRLTVTWTPQRDHSHTYPATVIGRSPALDLAVIKIAATNLPAVTLGDSANLQVGQHVLAIGNPYGLPGTMSHGIISSIRTVQEGQDEQTGNPGADIENAIQTDAPINPGNSGGPMLNSQGQVIGIDTMILSQTGSNVGIGFAIPIDSAKAVLQQMITTGKVQAVTLGAETYPVSPDVAQQLGLDVDHGLMVLAVSPGSLAARAGLRVGNQPGYIGNTRVNFGGDIILAYNGEALQDPSQLGNLLLLQKPDSTFTLTVERSGKQIEIPVHLGQSM